MLNNILTLFNNNNKQKLKKNLKKLSINKIKIKYKKNINIFNPGQIIYIKYILFKENEIKEAKFIGICLSISKKYTTFVLKNKIKKENILLLLYFFSPLILNIKTIVKYKKKYRLNKLYFKLK